MITPSHMTCKIVEVNDKIHTVVYKNGRLFDVEEFANRGLAIDYVNSHFPQIKTIAG